MHIDGQSFYTVENQGILRNAAMFQLHEQPVNPSKAVASKLASNAMVAEICIMIHDYILLTLPDFTALEEKLQPCEVYISIHESKSPNSTLLQCPQRISRFNAVLDKYYCSTWRCMQYICHSMHNILQKEAVLLPAYACVHHTSPVGS